MPAKKDEQGKTALWLMALIEDFLTINGMENDGNSFGWLALKDRTLVERMRGGGDLSTTKMDKVIAFLRNPDRTYKTVDSEGAVVMKTLRPLTFNPKEL